MPKKRKKRKSIQKEILKQNRLDNAWNRGNSSNNTNKKANIDNNSITVISNHSSISSTLVDNIAGVRAGSVPAHSDISTNGKARKGNRRRRSDIGCLRGRNKGNNDNNWILETRDIAQPSKKRRKISGE